MSPRPSARALILGPSQSGGGCERGDSRPAGAKSSLVTAESSRSGIRNPEERCSREQQVEDLLHGDMSVIEEPLRDLHQRVQAVHTRIRSLCPPGPCPEYEHFRKAIKTRRRRIDHERFDNGPHTLDSVEENEVMSETSSMVALAGEASTTTSTAMERPQSALETATADVSSSVRPEYEWFRSQIRERQRSRRREQSIVEENEAVGSVHASEGTETRSEDDGNSSTSHNDAASASSSLMDDVLWFQQSDYHGEDCPKQLGQVRELLGTLLGKAPSTPSPFEDTESVEVVFDT